MYTSQLRPYLVFGSLFVVSLACAMNVDLMSGAGFFLLQYRAWEVLIGVITCHALIFSNLFSSVVERKFCVGALFWPQILFVMLETIALWLFQYPKYSLLSTICGLAGTTVFFISGHGYEWRTIYLNDVCFYQVPLLNYLYGMSVPAYFGRISYALYLWHFPIAVLCADFKDKIQLAIGPSESAAFSLQFVILTVISILTHHFIENPFRWWSPATRSLPAVCVLLLMGGIELWLHGMYKSAANGAIYNALNKLDLQLPPLLGETQLVAYLGILFVPVITVAWNVFSFNSSVKAAVWKIKPLVLGLFLLLFGFFLGSNNTRGNIREIKVYKEEVHLGEPLVDDVVYPSTFWNWRGGTHSFLSFGCACRGNTALRVPPGATSAPDLPQCFDIDRWNAMPFGHERYQFLPNDCSSKNDTSLSADKLWQKCSLPGRPDAGTRPTAFVLGSSRSYLLRWAVANAIGGEFVLFGLSYPNFAEAKLLSSLSFNNSEVDVTNVTSTRIYFDANSFQNFTENKVEKRLDLIDKLLYVQRIGEILDLRLSKGDLVFFDWSQGRTVGELTYHKEGLEKLGALVSARGAKLVITTARYHYGQSTTKLEYSEKIQAYLKRQQSHETVLQSLASKGSFVYWPYGEELCGSKCSTMISGTNMTISAPIIKPQLNEPNLELKADAWHVTAQAQAYLAPFLCSFLKQQGLLMPKKHNLHLHHDRVSLNTDLLRKGKDQYFCRIFRLPNYLRHGAITQIQYEFNPSSHQAIVHHSTLYTCTGMVNEIGVSFVTKGHGTAGCNKMIWTQGMNSPPSRLPFLPDSDEQMAILLEAEFLLLEVHYKAPSRAEAKKIQLLQQPNLVDSSGLTLIAISQDEANRLGTTLKYVQMLTVGPLSQTMLTVPPGLPNVKITSVCPNECLDYAIKTAKVPEILIFAVILHAHSAATAMFGELVDLNTNTSTVFSNIPDYREYIKEPETFRLLRKPVSVTRDHALKVTCAYNTTGRQMPTVMGPTMQDEMCFMYLLISPPVPDFYNCWHVDQRIHKKLGVRASHTPFCRADCGGAIQSLEFKLPSGSSRWSSINSTTLGERWPGEPVCEE